MLDGYSAPEAFHRPDTAAARRLFLITGGCGFIGSHLAESLMARGHLVRVLDDLSHGRMENLPRGVEFVEGDVADPMVLRRAIHDVDGCFHLAAISSVIECHSRWLEAHRTNLTGTINVFDAARRARPNMPVPVVYASSAAVYGNQDAAPLDESLTPNPVSSCGADKAGCELHAHIATSAHGVPAAGLRFFNVFGPRQSAHSPYSGVVPSFCQHLAEGRGVTIFGDGAQTRDFVYVTDAVMALMEAMAHLPRESEVFNVCTGHGISISELAGVIAGILGVEPKISYKPARPSDVRHSIGNPERARTRLGFIAETDLETGLRLTLNALKTVGVL